MRPVETLGNHDHEVHEVESTDRAEARARLRYASDLRFVTDTPASRGHT
jgi:hypothetical protein